MNDLTVRTILPGTELVCLRDQQSAGSCFSIRMLCPPEDYQDGWATLLPELFLQGTRLFPTHRSICRRLEELYGGEISPSVLTAGELCAVGFTARFPSDRITGEPVTAEAIELLGQLFTQPRTRGHFYYPYMELVRNRRLSALNNGPDEHRLLYSLISNGAVWGISPFGTQKSLSKVTNPKLFALWNRLLLNCRVQIVSISDQPVEFLERQWRTALVGLPRRSEYDPLPEIVIKPTENPIHIADASVKRAYTCFTTGLSSLSPQHMVPELLAVLPELRGGPRGAYDSFLGLLSYPCTPEELTRYLTPVTESEAAELHRRFRLRCLQTEENPYCLERFLFAGGISGFLCTPEEISSAVALEGSDVINELLEHLSLYGSICPCEEVAQ